MAQLRYYAGDFDRAAENAQMAIRIRESAGGGDSEDLANDLFYLASALSGAGKYEECAKSCSDALEQPGGERCRFLELRARALHSLGDPAAARRDVLDALSLSSPDAEADAELSVVLDSARPTGAAPDCPGPAGYGAAACAALHFVFFCRALCRRGSGRFEEALADIDCALSGLPGSDAYLASHADILIELGRFDDALESLGKALEANPSNESALDNRV